MNRKIFIAAILILLSAIFISAQRNPRPPQNAQGEPQWAKIIDANGDKNIGREEYRAAADAFFAELDKNKNGFLELGELPPQDNKPPRQNLLPPKHPPVFLFLNRGEFNLSKQQFDEKTNLRFTEFDSNANGTLEKDEIREIRPPMSPPMPPPPMAQFIGAEMRFGRNSTVKNAPFSAETVRTENKRLFDGTILKNESKGFIYRDGEGRTRQEQPLERIGGFPVYDENNQSRLLVNIFDVVAGEIFSLNERQKTVFKVPFAPSPLASVREKNDGKTESLGTKTFEGVNAEGTLTTLEIPAGQIGNDKPIYVVTEKWFSPQLQTIVYSKHSDPFIGEVVFRLVNIKLGEPAPELFKIPADYRMITPEENRRIGNEKNRQTPKPVKQ